MIWIAAICLLGIPAGFLLLWRVPLFRATSQTRGRAVTIIIPARNEEQNLPTLLGSIRQSKEQPDQVLVVDDDSKDATAAAALRFGARVLPSQPLPPGWTGKNWACHQGAKHAATPNLLFLDADTFFAPSGYTKIASTFSGLQSSRTALSVLPYHVIQKPYEELSLFFNLLMAMGAGGFGWLGKPRLFGQALILTQDTYARVGGHQAVSHSILENFAMSSRITDTGGRCVCLGGRETLHIRMFPHGFSQLREGWTKAFTHGATGSDPKVLAVSVIWLASLCATALMLPCATGHALAIFAFLYLAFAIQIFSFARQIGNFSPFACLLYPVPLLFYFVIFAQSLFRRIFKRAVTWRGRSL